MQCMHCLNSIPLFRPGRDDVIQRRLIRLASHFDAEASIIQQARRTHYSTECMPLFFTSYGNCQPPIVAQARINSMRGMLIVTVAAPCRLSSVVSVSADVFADLAHRALSQRKVNVLTLTCRCAMTQRSHYSSGSIHASDRIRVGYAGSHWHLALVAHKTGNAGDGLDGSAVRGKLCSCSQ